MNGSCMKKLKALRLMAIFLCLLFHHSSMAKKTNNKDLVIGVMQEIDTLNPITCFLGMGRYVYSLYARRLVSFSPDWKWVPTLATKIPSIKEGDVIFYQENGQKKMKVQWEIRPNAKWGDGTPLTGHDVHFSWKIGNNPNVSVKERSYYSAIAKVVVDTKNSKKFTFYYDYPRWDFHQMHNFEIVPKHLEEPIYEKYKKQKLGYDQNSLYTKKPQTRGLYNGPYRIVEFKRGSHVMVTRNDHFFGKRPAIKNIIVKLIPNSLSLISHLETKNINMIGQLMLTFDQALNLQKRNQKKQKHYQVNLKSSLLYEHLSLQLKKGPLTDINVRKALMYALNRQNLVNALFAGKLDVAHHFLAPLDPWYTNDKKNVVTYPFSRRKAKKLLEKSKWILGKDGYRYKNGQKLTIEMGTTAGDKLREMIQVYLKSQWKKIGVEIVIKNQPARTFFSETVKKGKYTGMSLFAYMATTESIPRALYHSKSIPTKKNGHTGFNFGHWKQPQVDSLIEKLEKEFNPQKRKELAQKILYYYTKEVPIIPLYYRADVSVTPKNLKGYSLSGNTEMTTNWAENWEFL